MGAIVLDKPEQINMWVLLSRRHQLQLHMKGLKVPGIVKWCKANISGAESARTAKDCVVPVEFAISQAGGEIDYELVNLHIMRIVRPGIFQDLGIYDSPSDIQPGSPMAQMYQSGQLEIVLTVDSVRPANGELFTGQSDDDCGGCDNGEHCGVCQCC